MVLNHNANSKELFQHMKVGDMDMIGPGAIHSLYKQSLQVLGALDVDGVLQTCDLRFLAADSQVVTLRRPSGSTITVEEVKITLLQRFFKVPTRKQLLVVDHSNPQHG